MGKPAFLPMEFSMVVMITVAVFLAHGDSPPGKTGDKNYVPGRVSDGPVKERTERVASFEARGSQDKTVYGGSDDKRFRSPFENYEGDETDSENVSEVEKRKNDKKQYNRKFKYDPALALMGLGKRISQYDPALRYMGLGKRNFQYDPALKYMGLGKRNFQYDPALRYMGLGKRGNAYDPGLKYMGLGKRSSMYDPGLKYMGLGKREYMYEPTKEYDFDDNASYETSNTALNDNSMFSYEDSLPHSGIYKRKNKFDPALKYMGLGKRKFVYDPAMKYMGLGKRDDKGDSTESYPSTISPIFEDKTLTNEEKEMSVHGSHSDSEINKRALGYISKLNNRGRNKDYVDDGFGTVPGLGKRPYKFDPALRFMGLGKRAELNRNYPELGKRPYKFDPALKYMGLGKREQPSLQRDTGKYENSLSDIFDENETTYSKASNLNEPAIESESPNDKFDKKAGNDKSGNNSNKKSQEVKFIEQGIGHTGHSDVNTEEHLIPSSSKIVYDQDVMYMGIDKRGNKYDPALLYMGLGKRGIVYDPRMYYRAENDDEIKYGGSTHQYVGLGQPQVIRGKGNKINVDILELAKHSNETNGCGDTCLKRKKRNLKARNALDTENFVEDHSLSSRVPEIPNGEENEIGNYEWHTIMKRERDNRPRYNPGWIFIGLGKRDGENVDISSIKGMENRLENQLKYNILFEDYYGLLDKIKDKIQNIKFFPGDKVDGYSKSSKKIKHKLFPHKQQNEVREDEYIWSLPTTPQVVISDGIPADTWLDFVPTITKIGK